MLVGSNQRHFDSNLTTKARLEADEMDLLPLQPAIQAARATAVRAPAAADILPAAQVPQVLIPPVALPAPSPATEPVENPAPQDAAPVQPSTAVSIPPVTISPTASPAAPPPPTLKIQARDGQAGSVTLQPLPGAMSAQTGPPPHNGAVQEQQPLARPAQERPSPSAADVSSSSRAMVIAPFGLKLRAEPRSDAPALKVLPDGAVVTLLGKADNGGATTWRQVSFAGVSGWAAAAFLRRLSDLPPQP
jgi:hypothetical protein